MIVLLVIPSIILWTLATMASVTLDRVIELLVTHKAFQREVAQVLAGENN